MVVNTLIGKIEKEGHQFKYLGLREKEVYAVQILSEPHDIRDSHVIYISNENVQLESGEYSILVVGNAEEAKNVFLDIQGILLMDIGRKDSLLKLQRDIMEGYDIYELAKQCYHILECPILFVNETFNIVCQYPEETDSKKSAEYHIADEIEKWRNAYEKTQSEEKWNIRQVSYRGIEYYLCIMKNSSANENSCEQEYLQRICSLFDAGPERKRGGEKEEMQTLLTEVFQRRINFSEETKKQFHSLGWKRAEKYYVLAIDKESAVENAEKEIADILKNAVYVTGKYYVSILYSDKYTEYTEKHFSELNKYLHKNRMYGILSMGFLEMESIVIRYEQCKGCLGILTERNSYGLFYFGRYQMTYVLTYLNKDRSFDLRTVCSPVLLQLYEIDKKENTDYITTLYIYLCSGQTMKSMAEALHIHINTLYARINKLKDEFKIDFTDTHMMYTLHNSIIFLHMYDNSCIKNPYPFVK